MKQRRRLIAQILFIGVAMPTAAWAHGEGGSEVETSNLEPPPPGMPAIEVGHGEGHATEPSGHHAMTHPFLSHMGLPDGPGEVSVRVTGIQRGLRDSSATDLAFHVEAGIANRLGLHLRNDAITGAGMSSPNGEMEDHGTELMLMYAVLQDAEATRGLSVFAEVAVPTIRRDGPSMKYGGGAGGRFILATRVQWDGIVHVSPVQGGGVEIGYETTLVVRAAGRIFGLFETRGEAGHGDTTNYVLFASKVGLGRTGATIGAGLQFATTSARTYDRQAMFQLDRAF